MSYSIGLDCGIASVGYAILELDTNEEPCRIIKLGARIFNRAENPKDGSSLAKSRREARSARRRLRRHRFRLQRIRELIVESGLLTCGELERLFDGELTDIYELRTKALDKPIERDDFARILIHLAQRRGFKSNRKIDSGDAEDGKLLNAVSKNEVLMKEKGYRTVGEMFYTDEVFATSKRNKGEKYLNTVSRALVEAEIKQLFSAQRAFKGNFATTDMEEEYLEIVLSQRSFEEGPGGNSPYGGNQIEKMLGQCTFYSEEKRAVKASYSFQYFTLLQNINNIKIGKLGETRFLNDIEREKVNKAAHKTADLNYEKIRKELNLSADDVFAGLSYGRIDVAEVEKKTKFNYLKAYHEIRKALKRQNIDIASLSKVQLNSIGYAFTAYKNDEKLTEDLKSSGFKQSEIEALLKLPSFTKAGHISLKACDMIIPFLEQGMKYDMACEAAGIPFKAHKADSKHSKLPANAPELESVNNPVVRRAVSQTIKVVNAIIREQGESPIYINIELAREMAKNFDERRKSETAMKDNMAYNSRIKEEITKHHHKTNPTGMDIVKLKLYKEQDGRCPYSLKSIDYNRLFEEGYVDIDHIIPYSISFDDSYKNKVLVLAAENRQKGNRLPMQYLQGKRLDDFIVWVNTNVRDYKKRQILLKETITDEDTENFKVRNLQDTQYLSRFLLNYIRDYLVFAPSITGKKKRVTAVNGAVTGYMRKRWGIQKIREDGDLHHAADAAVIGCITDGIIRKVSQYAKRKETFYTKIDNTEYVMDKSTGELTSAASDAKDNHFPPPWPYFRDELEIRLSKEPARILAQKMLPNYWEVDIEQITPCFVSRMPRHKVTGAAHKDTVRSPKAIDEGLVISKKAIAELKLDENGEIAGYYMPQSDKLLYTAVKQRLTLLKALEKDTTKAGKERYKQALAQPMSKPKADGTPGPLVKKVRITEKSSLTVDVHAGTGVANNDTMVRADIFFVEGEGYYFVPIYIADTVKSELPNKACVAYKPYELWKNMSDENFIFSLYPNDLVRITTKTKLKLNLINTSSTLAKEIYGNELFLYYVGADIATASIAAINDENTHKSRGIGIKSLRNLEKYQVDVLGNYYCVKNEKRQRF